MKNLTSFYLITIGDKFIFNKEEVTVEYLRDKVGIDLGRREIKFAGVTTLYDFDRIYKDLIALKVNKNIALIRKLRKALINIGGKKMYKSLIEEVYRYMELFINEEEQKKKQKEKKEQNESKIKV